MTGWRRIADAMWGPPADPQVFGALELDAVPALRLIERARATGHRVTPTHIVGRALAHALAAVPALNARIRNGRLYPRPTIDVFFITAIETAIETASEGPPRERRPVGGGDLSGVKVEAVDRMSVLDVAHAVTTGSARLRHGEDREFARSKRLMDALPTPVLRRALRATAFLTEQLGLDLPGLGLHHAPFGSAMVTSVGMLGIPQGFAPLAWMYDVPLLVLVGEIAKRPVVHDDVVVARPLLPITATIDHRYADGWHISRAMTAFRAYLAAPERFEPALARAA